MNQDAELRLGREHYIGRRQCPNDRYRIHGGKSTTEPRTPQCPERSKKAKLVEVLLSILFLSYIQSIFVKLAWRLNLQLRQADLSIQLLLQRKTIESSVL